MRHQWAKRKASKTAALPCFYCSADSTELKLFLILTIGGMVLCSVFVFLGLWRKGAFKDTEALSGRPLEAEEGEHNRGGGGE